MGESSLCSAPLWFCHQAALYITQHDKNALKKTVCNSPRVYHVKWTVLCTLYSTSEIFQEFTCAFLKNSETSYEVLLLKHHQNINFKTISKDQKTLRRELKYAEGSQ